MQMVHEKSSRTVRCADLPRRVGNVSIHADELTMTVGYAGGPDVFKAVALDNAVVPAMVAAVNATPALLASLRELCGWMREHTGPADGTHDMLVRAVEAIRQHEPDYPTPGSVPCAGCGRTDLPLHTDGRCPDCHKNEAQKAAAYTCAKCGQVAEGGLTVGSSLTARELGVNVGDYVCPPATLSSRRFAPHS
jgi:hypothetical protein